MAKIKMIDLYPVWICHDCALANGGNTRPGHCSTIHEDICGWCGKMKMVTEPRDYGYPQPPKKGRT